MPFGFLSEWAFSFTGIPKINKSTTFGSTELFSKPLNQPRFVEGSARLPGLSEQFQAQQFVGRYLLITEFRQAGTGQAVVAKHGEKSCDPEAGQNGGGRRGAFQSFALAYGSPHDPPNRISPEPTSISPAIIFMVVDLPEPFGPRYPVISPAGAEKLTLSRASTPGKRLETLRSSRVTIAALQRLTNY